MPDADDEIEPATEVALMSVEELAMLDPEAVIEALVALVALVAAVGKADGPAAVEPFLAVNGAEEVENDIVEEPTVTLVALISAEVLAMLEPEDESEKLAAVGKAHGPTVEVPLFDTWNGTGEVETAKEDELSMEKPAMLREDEVAELAAVGKADGPTIEEPLLATWKGAEDADVAAEDELAAAAVVSDLAEELAMLELEVETKEPAPVGNADGPAVEELLPATWNGAKEVERLAVGELPVEATDDVDWTEVAEVLFASVESAEKPMLTEVVP
ncbi:hypothetical protein H2203_003053 [Taxawa tesnikishii (nom. ined.)]|nr:hypothetical protein H2203_003053 [Dothideales sp. JES 119]